jgi:peptidoglycan/xylan/chitin deacetylase (PgdA/CDA1 family)
MSSMRSVLSHGPPGWGAVASSLQSSPADTARDVGRLLALVATVAAVALVLSGGGGSAGALGPPDPPGTQALVASIAGAPGQPAPSRLYRLVGCRSRGSGVVRGGPARREVAIGFDDGPARDTPAFVSMLARSHAQATFFMVGRQVSSAYRPTIMRELREGDVPGDHSFTHPYLTRSRDVRGELQRTISAIRAQSGYTPCVFRPPYGDVNAEVVRTARSLGLSTVTWNVDPSDYTEPGSSAVAQRVLAQVRPGSIIISHDGGGPRGQTLAAYPHIIAALHRRGFAVVTIPRLLGFHPVYVPCVRLCDGIGVQGSLLPRDAILQNAPA